MRRMSKDISRSSVVILFYHQNIQEIRTILLYILYLKDSPLFFVACTLFFPSCVSQLYNKIRRKVQHRKR